MSARLAEIMSVVVADFGVSEHDIRGPWARADIVEARHVFCWLARYASDRSFPQIGRYLGNRDHTTIMYAVRKLDGMREAKPSVKADTQRLLAIVTARRIPQDVNSFERQSTPKPAYKRDRLNSLEAV